MIIKKIKNLETIQGEEGTEISQIFHPHNTLDGMQYSISHCTLKPGKKSTLHEMKSSEVYFILEGTGSIHVDDEKELVSKHDAVFIPPLSRQFIENIGKDDLKFLCIVDPAWRQEDEVILD